MNLPSKVQIVEVGPRDGLQNEAVLVPTEKKVALIEALATAGIRRFEATSFVSPRRIPQLADAESVVAALPRLEGVRYGALIANERGYERARRAGVDEVVLVISATEGHSRANLNRSVATQLETFAAIATSARADRFSLRASVSTAFGCPFDGIPPLDRIRDLVSRIVDLGIAEITLCDTIGVADPRQVGEVFTVLRRDHPDVTFGAHFHDTRGLGVANALAALDAGISLFDSSIGALGGCPYAPGATGNVATEDLVYVFERMGIETGVSLRDLLKVSTMVSALVGHSVGARINESLSYNAPEPFRL